MGAISLQAGGVLIEDNKILLVQILYGANSGMWMLPGGNLEEGESIEVAAKREFYEETGIQTETDRLVGVRSGTREVNDKVLTTIYIVFEMKYKSGFLKKQEQEIHELKYWTIEEIEQSDQIVELSKEIALNAYCTRNGLYKGEEIVVNSNYKSYTYYIANQ